MQGSDRQAETAQVILIDDTGSHRLTEQQRLRLHIAMEHEDELVPLSASTAIEGAQKEVETRAVSEADGWQASVQRDARVAEIGEAFALGVVS